MTDFVSGIGGAAKAAQDVAQGFASIRESLERAAQPAIPLRSAADFSFPAKYVSDETPPATEKADLAGHLTGAPVQINVPITDRDVEIVRHKEQIKSQAQFDAWVSTRYQPHVDPTASEWLQKVYPEYFDMRAKENAERHLIKEKYESILLRGPKSKEELFLLYQLENDSDLMDRIIGNTGPDYNPDRWYDEGEIIDAGRGAEGISDVFIRGLFNPRQMDRMGDAAQLGFGVRGFYNSPALRHGGPLRAAVSTTALKGATQVNVKGIPISRTNRGGRIYAEFSSDVKTNNAVKASRSYWGGLSRLAPVLGAGGRGGGGPGAGGGAGGGRP